MEFINENKIKQMTDKQLADKIIKEMQAMGCTLVQMLKILKMAKEKFKLLKNDI